MEIGQKPMPRVKKDMGSEGRTRAAGVGRMREGGWGVNRVSTSVQSSRPYSTRHQRRSTLLASTSFERRGWKGSCKRKNGPLLAFSIPFRE